MRPLFPSAARPIRWNVSTWTREEYNNPGRTARRRWNERKERKKRIARQQSSFGLRWSYFYHRRELGQKDVAPFVLPFVSRPGALAATRCFNPGRTMRIVICIPRISRVVLWAKAPLFFGRPARSIINRARRDIRGAVEADRTLNFRRYVDSFDLQLVFRYV